MTHTAALTHITYAWEQKAMQCKIRHQNGTNLSLPYEWHTTVLTPPSSPVPIEEEQSTRLAFKEQLHDAFLKKCTDVLDADESNDLKTNLDKFMSSERYHSQCLQQQKPQQEQQRKQQQGEIEKNYKSNLCNNTFFLMVGFPHLRVQVVTVMANASSKLQVPHQLEVDVALKS
uniref:Uncharacterized protein n=1 Tax=Glossina pallidipes TaxID=7398 RepID=A0A1A9Z9H5_GLOPL